MDIEWDWFKNVAVAGDDAFGTIFYVGELITTDAINQDSFNGMSITKYFSTDGNFDKEHIPTPLINGEFGIFYQIGHGSGTTMCVESCWGDGAITIDDLLSYPQNDKQPILITINCLNGAFDTHLMDTDILGNPFPNGYSFSEASLMSEAGAIAYIGGTRTNYGGIDITLTDGSLSINSQPYMQSMLNHVVKGYHEGNNYLGDITNYALNSFVVEKDFSDDANYKTLFEFILLGDPALRLPEQQSGESYQKPQLNSLNAEEYLEDDYIGNLPVYNANREIILGAESNSPNGNLKVIDTYFKDMIIDLDIIGSLINFTYSFFLDNARDFPYQIRAISEDGKEGWFYLMVEEESGPPSNPNQILVVDDDIGDSLEDYYTDSLINSGYSFDVWNVLSLGSPDYDILSNYRVVIWLTGNSISSTLTPEDQNNLANYLDNGGNLFISGQDIGWDIGLTSFYQDYLHAQYVRDDTNIYILNGVSGDPITSYMQINISGGDGANNQYYPSEIDPVNGATSIFYYDETTEPFELYSEKFNEKIQEKNYFSLDSSGSGGLRIDTDAYKLVYLSFGFEAVNNQYDRDFLMRNIVDYLYYLDEYPPSLYQPFAELGENQPGGLITLNVHVYDENEIEYVKADIKKDGEIVDTLTLYDDGLHDDEGDGDGVYGNNWFADEENNFSVDISSSDEYGNSIVYGDILRFTSSPFLPSSKIIVIYNEKYTNLHEYYTETLLNNNYEFDAYNIQQRGRPYSYLYDGYENGVVIWVTGNDWSTTLSKKDQNNLARYLDNGGNLFISGQDIGYDLTKYGSVHNSFFANYLHAEFIKDNVNLNRLNGIYGNEISGGLSIGISEGDGANNQYYPSEIDPINGAISVFTYDLDSEYSFSNPNSSEYERSERPQDIFGISSTGSGAISYNNDIYKLVYFSFGFEAINDYEDRSEVMKEVVNSLIDLFPPEIELYRVEDGYDCYFWDEYWHNNKSLTIKITTEETANYIGFSIDGGEDITCSDCSEMTTPLLNLDEGDHIIDIYASDYSGNIVNKSFNFHVDIQNPELSLTAHNINLGLESNLVGPNSPAIITYEVNDENFYYGVLAIGDVINITDNEEDVEGLVFLSYLQNVTSGDLTWNAKQYKLSNGEDEGEIIVIYQMEEGIYEVEGRLCSSSGESFFYTDNKTNTPPMKQFSFQNYDGSSGGGSGGGGCAWTTARFNSDTLEFISFSDTLDFNENSIFHYYSNNDSSLNISIKNGLSLIEEDVKDNEDFDIYFGAVDMADNIEYNIVNLITDMSPPILNETYPVNGSKLNKFESIIFKINDINQYLRRQLFQSCLIKLI